MSAIPQNQPPTLEEATTVNTIATQQELQTPKAVIEQSDSNSTAYNAFLEIQNQIQQFEKLINEDQSVAITLPEYPFFTETRLHSLIVHQSGSISIFGEARGGKLVSVRDQVASLSYALSITTRPVNGSLDSNIEVGFITSLGHL